MATNFWDLVEKEKKGNSVAPTGAFGDLVKKHTMESTPFVTTKKKKKKEEEKKEKKKEDEDIAPVKTRREKQNESRAKKRETSKYLSGEDDSDYGMDYAPGKSVLEQALAYHAENDDVPVMDLGPQGQGVQSTLDDGAIDFFQKGAFEDGFQASDLITAPLGTVGDAALGLIKGFARAGEGVADGVANMIIAPTADFLGGDEFADRLRDAADLDLVGDLTKPATDYLDKYSVLGRTLDSTAEGLGQIGFTVGTFGAGQALGLGAKGASVLSKALMGLSSAGSSSVEAHTNGATDAEAWTHGAISGASTVIWESLFGGLGNAINMVGFNKGALPFDDMAAQAVSKLSKSQTGKNIISYLVKGGFEGLEEVGEGFTQALSKKLTYMSEEEFGKILKDENLFEQFVVGMLTSDIAQTGDLVRANKSGRDFVTGLNADEQTVVDKATEALIAEREKKYGRKLTNKEQTEARKEIRENLDRGGLDIDSIAEILGGDSYKAFKAESDSFFGSDAYKAVEEAERNERLLPELQKRYDELNAKMPEKKTGAEQNEEATLLDRINAIKNAPKSEELKAKIDPVAHKRLMDSYQKMHKDTFARVKDSILAESYMEHKRSQEKLDIDINKYKDENARKTVQAIIDSGLGDNSNAFKHFVDFMAKIAADKKTIAFDLTNNERLYGTDHARTGLTTNGYKLTDENGTTIVINKDAANPLRVVVGHEFAHVLEKSGFYDAIADSVLKYAETKEGLDNLNARIREAERIYKDDKNTTPEKEVVADLIGEYVFTDYEFISNLASTNPKGFMKLFAEVKYLARIATAGSKEARELAKVKNNFERAYREFNVADSEAKSDGDVQHSYSKPDFNKDEWSIVNRRKHSEFDNPKYDLDNGNKWMYANEKGYTVFAIYSKSDPEDPTVMYGSSGKKADSDYEKLNSYWRGELNVKRTNTNTNRRTLNAILADINSSTRNESYGISAVAEGESAAGNVQLPIAERGSNGSGNFGDGSENLRAEVTEYNDEASDDSDASFITFSNDYQFYRNFMKEGDVGEPDTQYSLSADSDGNKLSAGQKEFFKDSKVVDKDGNLLKVYHTTNNDFTVFDKGRKGETTGDYNTYLGFFFADTPEYMSQFPEFENGKTETYYLNMKNPIDMNNISKQAFLDIVEATGGDVQEAAEHYDQEYADELKRAKFRGDNSTIMEMSRLLEDLTGEYFDYAEFYNALKPNYDQLMSKGYDGIINTLDGRGWANEYIVLDSNQAKLTSNKNPTADPDIRYSFSGTAEEVDLAKGYLDSKSIQYSYSAVPSHKKSLQKNFSLDHASLELPTIMERYDKILDIWERLGGELDSKFLNDWNNKVERPFTVFKAQAGYKYNVELSSMCKKGVPLFEAIDQIVKQEVMKELNTDVLGKEEKEILYDILKKHNFEIPCAICYVEQARQREGVIIDAFLNGKTDVNGKGETTGVKLGWNQVLDAIQKEMKANGVDHNFAFVSRDIATDKYDPADLSMDEQTYAAFGEAVKKLANEEIVRYNKETGKRRKLLKDVTPAAVKETFKGTLPSNLKIFKVLLTEPSSRFKIQDDLLYSSMTTKNLTMAHNGLYSLFNSQGGVSGYKTKQAPTVYWGEILGKKWKPEDTRKEGGVRNQSNSDFQMFTLLDQAQMYMDFSAKGYYLQAYTKVLSELKLFGLSKSKINASLIPQVKVYRNADGTVDVEKTMENAGLDENGNPFYDDIEGINHKEAFMLLEDPEYSKNIGGICIGYSDKHIAKLLDDDRVQLIIGFHDKTNDPDKRYRGARYAKNYNGLNEAVDAEGKTKHIGFNPYVKKAEQKFQYNSETEAFEGTVTYNGKTYTADDIPRLAADMYLEMCAKKGYTPAYADFSGHRNYYKLLADFSLYDSQGHYAPHRKVAYDMPDTVPYLDADGNKQYMKTEDYIKIELQKELSVRDAIAEAMADTSEDGIIPQFVAEVNKRQIAPVQNSFSAESTEQSAESKFLKYTRGAVGRNSFADKLADLAPVAEENTVTAEAPVAVAQTETPEEMFPEAELESLNQQKEALESRMQEAMAAEDVDAFTQVGAEYDAVMARIAELDQEIADADAGRMESLMEEIPPEAAEQYNDGQSDVIPLTKKTLTDIAREVKSVLGISDKKTFDVHKLIEDYSKREFPSREDLFNDLKENFGTYTEKYTDETIQAAKKHLRTNGMYVADYIQSEIADYADLRRRNRGRIRFSPAGTDVDVLYHELNSLYPGLFPESIIAPTDQFLRMVDVANMSTTAEMSHDVGDDALWEATDYIIEYLDDYKYVEREKTSNQFARESFDSLMQEADKYMPPVEEDIAPVVAPVDEIAPTAENVTTEENVPTGEAQKPVNETLAAKIAGIQTELDNNRRLRDESSASFDQEIARLQAEYNAKKNKNTLGANDLLRRIERMKRLKQTVDADFGKRIGNLEARIEKMSSPDYQTAEQRRTKMQEHTSFWETLLGDTSTWKDLPLGLSYKTKTLRRILRKVVRDANGNPDIGKADMIYDALETKYDHNEALLKRESRKLKAVFQELNLNHAEDTYANMLGEFRHNPETTLTEDVVKEYYNKHKNKIDVNKVDTAIEEARKTFDDLIVRVNEVLKAQGMKEIPYRKGYFPHFTNPKQNWFQKLINWKPVDNEIPTSIAGLTEMFTPQRSWQSFNKQRKGDTTDYSLYQGLDTYIHGALDWIYHIDDLQSRRALENYIRYIHSDEGVKAKIEEIKADETYDADEAQAMIEAVLDEAKNPLNGLVTELMRRTNTLANKKAAGDRKMEDDTSRKVYSVMTNLNNRVNANMVVGSFSSALTNFIPMVQSWVQVNPWYTLRGLGDYVRSTIKDDGMIEKSDYLTNRLMEEENLYQTGWDKVSDKAAWMMNVIDSITSQTVWRSKYLQNKKEGMSESQAIKDADQFAKNLMAGRSRGNMPTVFDEKNPFTKIFTAFQLEVANQYGYMFNDAVKDSKSPQRLVAGYATAFLGSYLYNALYSSLVGRNAAFDPMSIIEELLRDLGVGDDDDEEDEENVKDALLGLGENIIQEVPFVGGLLGGGRIPISSALPYNGDFQTIFNDAADGEFQFKELLKPLYYLALPVGGGQIRKTNEGLAMFLGDHPVSGSYTASGKLRYPVEKTFGNVVQAAMFGQYANENARYYFDNDIAPLGEKQIQEYMDVDLPIRDYWDYRKGLKGKDTLGEKLAYIDSLDLPIRKQNILANNLTDRKEPIDMADWDKYDGLEEYNYAKEYPEKHQFLESIGISYDEYESFDDDTKDAYSWAYQNPEKYTMSKAVTSDLVEYKRYTSELSDIKADKDAYGDTISGSAKEKKIEYINNLDLDYGQKIILYRSLYSSQDDRDAYNSDILDYLNSRDDLSYDEIVTILRELDFTVLDDGTVLWD